ncbi:uncharacterized protein Z520_01156 [Fonsecaea multimorphosa CBS 102226]|uniref:Uncharacterized protein n=1 Tax=Fonsecaea multimorphosa CBS 102226 TaxID=1442371 RepID=A0A0D2HL86_9EURO|nr:uncharacterized protein Z520_01156 [Fonsecaea multimorphosa CBS 102226]KIY02691.1 hypothetical protein Z520_01156 [Fonsecaea multimorphosa CBS 102226]OAL31553.1 hypothetical protein AYO22_01145 [Fonsecaea multimorphosa]
MEPAWTTMNLLKRALDAELGLTAATSFALGVIFHQGIRPIEIDNRVWTLLILFSSFNTAAFFGYAFVVPHGILAAGLRVFVVDSAFLAGVYGSIAIYRLFFHRLRKFPGPWGAKLSRFWALKRSLRKVQFNYEVETLHKQYGDFVRIGPREISINRASAIDLVYGPPSKLPKSTWYSQVSDDINKCSINSTRDMQVHRQRRRAWDRGFSVKALSTYEPRVKAKTDLLLSRIAASGGSAMNITEWSMFYTFDVMGDIGLSKDFEMLTTGGEHKAIKGLHDQMITIGTLGTLPWLLAFFSAIPGIAGTFQDFMEYCREQLEEKKRSTGKDQEPRDVISWLIKAKYENDHSAPPSDFALSEDTRLIIIAGSDTTAAALANTFFYLARNPTVQQKLQKELDTIFPAGEKDWTYEKAKFPYLDNIINESLRLKPPVPGGLPRITPPQGLQIDEIYIPGDTIVGVPVHTLQRDPRYFERPLEFIPERWEQISTEKSPFFPFSKGAFGCVGKQLAMMELRMVLSRVALGFDISFADGEDGVKFDAEVMDTFTLTLPPLKMKFTRRQSKTEM